MTQKGLLVNEFQLERECSDLANDQKLNIMNKMTSKQIATYA